MIAGDLEGHHHTVSSPRDMDPTNLRVETVLEAMIPVAFSPNKVVKISGEL